METKQIAQYVTAELDRRDEQQVAEIIARAESLRDRMTRLIEALTTNGGFNTLGEVQGAGSEIDRLIGELVMLRQIKKDLPSMIEHADILAAIFGKKEQE